ncbi:MAG: hypothetical protein QOF58_2309 [Pseudonocardiales bacterium]|jgi:NAD(P)-dependent dehydrogenase (short-subunit alcohol dehydrogenase family)|nr:hypothetical protein [Pseudonocardiales bacterium]
MAVAVVTGAGSGVGRAAARTLLAAGFQVALAGRREDALRETGEGFPDTAFVVPIDVSHEDSVVALFEAVVEKWGRVDVLFNNAGTNVRATPIEEFSLSAWEKVVGVNLTGAFLCAREAFKVMKAAGGGRIINNGSISASVPRPHAVAYNATKHAMTGLTKTLSLEGRAFGIACGQIDIGNAATEMTARMGQGVLQANFETKPEPTFDVRHVADAVLYQTQLPLNANVQFMTVMATTMPYIGRG